MLDTEHRSTIEQVSKPRRTGLITSLAVVVLAAAGVGTWLLVRGDQPTGTEVIQDFAAAMRADDMASVEGFDATTVDGGFIEWQIATRAEPVFSDCSEANPTLPTTVSCTVTYGPDYFYGRVVGETMTTSVAGRVDEDGVFTGTLWPPPPGLTDVEADLRVFVRDVHPELEGQLWGGPGYLGITMTRESGELRLQLLDEFLAYEPPAAFGPVEWSELTPIEVAETYFAAIGADEMAVVPGFDPTTVDGGFIEWHIAMNLEPQPGDCVEAPVGSRTRVTCTITAGDDYFYSVISGETMTGTASGMVDADGVYEGSSWPPPPGLLEADSQFRTWVREAHPELEDQLWGPPGYIGIKMTRESGELRMQLRDEYLASLS